MSQCTKPDALKTQVSGTYYSDLKIQPVEFILANGWDFCAGSITKYVSRHASKNGRQDLDKASHFISLRFALIPLDFAPAPASIEISAYCQANDLPIPESQVLQCLSDWVYNRSDRSRLELIVALDNLIWLRYGSGVPEDHPMLG